MPSTEYVTSADGTPIAFDRHGAGEPVILIGGILCDRQTTLPLAQQLATRVGVVNYDRRGRGDSKDTAPYTVEREIDDLAALIDAAGGVAAVYGHSSGAGLALRAAAAGLAISRLVLHEPPYGAADEQSKRDARELAGNVRDAVEEGRHGDAIARFLTEAGMPPEMVEQASTNPSMQAIAVTMPYDFDVMGDFDRGGAVPEELVRAVRIPTLVISGGASPDFFRDAAAHITELLPNGISAVLEGHDHGAPADVVAPVVADFLDAP
ncbi:pimeloyl-ACP methyl ester carboxylesterase [Haloactinopolyspora alba]|uniref:Pimeloyl-ACP methyl ester carboxylesterase n=1 Tax=Haloactinopolyspora alba TaxID=648780 RepID=A0A2P8DY11_9ACTN|nr:alpha/beta hydrolase [Haloactinopolyspora alba]PSL02092.1 pimeloyl-ACP methyl ester carboxylesterase [Haloactinopolyspora alba]